MKKFLILLCFIFFSCSEEEFSRTTVGNAVKVDPIKVDVEQSCSNYSPPPVDILLLVDNSGSIAFLKRDLRSALVGLVQEVSKLTDYRIYIAPLMPVGTETDGMKRNFQVITSDPTNLPLSAQVVGVNNANLDFAVVNTGQERGFDRALDLLQLNSNMTVSGNTVFRKKAFTMVVTLSNGDDNKRCTDAYGNWFYCNFETYKQSFLSIKSSLASLQLRYISVVNFEKCGSTIDQPGVSYRYMSKLLYDAQGLSGGGANYDSYNLCKEDLSKIFKNLKSTIDSFKQGHTYSAWPVKIATSSSQLDFDPNKLEIKKKTKNGMVVVNKSATNGFTYTGFKSNFNIREYPVVSQTHPAETYTGFFVQLNGDGKTTYPDCLVVRREDFDKFYGYIVLSNEPDVSTLKIVIDGKTIPKGGANGWTYVGFKESQNILVKSQTDDSAKNPGGIFKTGYTIKLSGDAIYNDGADVDVYYKSAPIN
jgi:hypothetical protein